MTHRFKEQEMMMTKKEKKRVPELRFEGFEGGSKKMKLGDICSFYSGGTPSSTNKSYYSGDIPFIGSGNISDDYVSSFITVEALNSSSAKLVEKGDLLYALYGATSGEVAISNIDGAINQAVLCIKTNENKYYLYQLLKYTKNRIVSKFIQGGQGNLSASIIKELKFSFPSKEEQQKIATFLTTIDTRIQQLEKKKTLLEQYKKGVMQKIFSQEIRFKDEDGKEFGEWEKRRLGELGEIITGKTPSTSNPDLWNGDIHFVTPTDIDGNKYQYKTQRTVARTSKMKVLPLKSILFTCIASIGKMSLSTKPCITNQQINSIVPYEEFDNEFVYYSLLNMVEYIKSTQSTNTLPIINKTEFSKFKINVPKDLEEQTKIAQFLSALDRKIAAMDGQIEKTKEWKKGLLQRMFI